MERAMHSRSSLPWSTLKKGSNEFAEIDVDQVFISLQCVLIEFLATKHNCSGHKPNVRIPQVALELVNEKLCDFLTLFRVFQVLIQVPERHQSCWVVLLNLAVYQTRRFNGQIGVIRISQKIRCSGSLLRQNRVNATHEIPDVIEIPGIEKQRVRCVVHDSV